MKTLKITVRWLLLMLLVLPAAASGAETYTLEIDFSFASSTGSAKQLQGYRLYQEGRRICQSNQPSIASLSCTFSSEPGTFNFTLTAYYTDSTESPHSPAFPFTLGSSTSGTSSRPPRAAVAATVTVGRAPLTVTFNADASTSHNPPIAAYRWAFGDGERATGKTVSHVFQTAGTYQTRLTVVDSAGLTDKVRVPILVTGSDPTSGKPKASMEVTARTPLTYSFDGSTSADPDGSIVQYHWDFGDGTTGSGITARHSYEKLAEYTVTLRVTDSNGESSATSTLVPVLAATGSAALHIEAGEVHITQEWVRVPFAKRFLHPVVLAGPPISVNEAEPVLVRVRNVDREGFEIRLQEWAYQDGQHQAETVNYLVVEQGAYILDDGSKVEAATFRGTRGVKEIGLLQAYDLAPVILTQISSENDGAAIAGRVQAISRTSFEYRFQEEEQDRQTAHQRETIGYLAWEPGMGQLPGMRYEVGTLAAEVSHRWTELVFAHRFPELPFLIGGMQTRNGGNPATVRARAINRKGAIFRIQEEQSHDLEMKHAGETVGYLGISPLTSQ